MQERESIRSTTFEEELDRSGRLIYTNKGVSMQPLIREGRDILEIEKVDGIDCRKYDVVLFVRPDVQGRGHYVLHRILKKRKDGTFWIVGDNCTSGEIVSREQIIGRLMSVIRGKKTIRMKDFRYRLYVHLWCDLYPVRFWMLRIERYAYRILTDISKNSPTSTSGFNT